MMRSKSVIAVVLLAIAGLATAMFPSSSLAGSGTGTTSCSADITLTWSPNVLWPPNHKMVPITITGTDTDADSDEFLIQVVAITSDQPEAAGGGCGQPTPQQGADEAGVGNFALGGDPGPSASIDGVALRAERCANQGDRHYTIFVFCAESNTDFTNVVGLPVTVPKSQ